MALQKGSLAVPPQQASSCTLVANAFFLPRYLLPTGPEMAAASAETAEEAAP